LGRYSEGDKKRYKDPNFVEIQASKMGNNDYISCLNRLSLIDDAHKNNMSLIINHFGENFKKEFVFYAHQTNMHSLFDKDLNNLKINFDFKQFMDSNIGVLKQSDIIPKTYFTSSYINNSNESFLVLLAIIRDKCYQLYNQLTKPFDQMYERAKELIRNKVTDFEGRNASKEDVYAKFLNVMTIHVKEYLLYTKDLPGFSKICINDLNAIHAENMAPMFTLKFHKLHINGECYLMADDIQITRKWSNEIAGIKATDFVFDFHQKLSDLKLTDQEMSLIFPFIMTSTGSYNYKLISMFQKLIIK
jgi:hypothetical protein